MKRRSIDREPVLRLSAAAVLLALGSAHAAAQQPGSEQESERQQSTQQQQEQDRPGAASEQQDDEPQTAAADTERSGMGQTLDQIGEEHDDLSTFVEAVKAAGLEDALTGDTDYTVFAPTNDAFEQMSGMSTDELLQPENQDQLVSLLRAHIIADDVDEDMARSLGQAQTIDGGTVNLSAEQDQIRIGEASVVESGIQSGNLRLYAIDGVLSPTQVAAAEDTDQQQQQEREGAGAGETETEQDAPLGEEEEDPFGEEDDPFETQSEDEAGQQPGQDRPGAGSDQIGSPEN